jgi:hypothetical protein
MFSIELFQFYEPGHVFHKLVMLIQVKKIILFKIIFSWLHHSILNWLEIEFHNFFFHLFSIELSIL